MDNEPKIIKKIYVYPATSIQQMKSAQEYQQINRQLYQDQHIQKLMDMCLSNQMQSILNSFDYEDLQQPLKEVQYFLKDLKGKFIQQPKNKIKEPLISKIPNKNKLSIKTQLLASIKQKLTQMVQESKLFPSLINFIKIEYDQQNYQFNVCKLGLLNDAAEIMLQCGPFGILNAQIKSPTNLTITDLILELFRQLNHYNIVEDKEIAEEVWFSFNRAKIRLIFLKFQVMKQHRICHIRIWKYKEKSQFYKGPSKNQIIMHNLLIIREKNNKSVKKKSLSLIIS